MTEQFGWDRASVAFMASISVFVSGLLQPEFGLAGGSVGAEGVLCGLGFAATLQVIASSLVSNMSWSSTVSLLASTCADRYGRRGLVGEWLDVGAA